MFDYAIPLAALGYHLVAKYGCMARGFDGAGASAGAGSGGQEQDKGGGVGKSKRVNEKKVD